MAIESSENVPTPIRSADIIGPHIDGNEPGSSDPRERTEPGVSDLASLITSLAINCSEDKKVNFIDSTDAMTTVLDILFDQPTSPPSLYIDLEGINLSRDGSISILQIFVHPISRTYLLDVHTLGGKLFSTIGTSGRTLKALLESKDVPKVFFDVRNDSDALYSHFGIRLAGIRDLQLMELATRNGRKKFVNGLAKCIENDASMSGRERVEWKTTKERGLKMFAPEK